MRISVITATYNLIENNRWDTFQRAVASVRAQMHADIEHGIVDGGSTDGTVERLREMEAGGELVLLHSAPDTGVYQAMNRGIAAASGDYVMYLTSDDFYHRETGLADIASVATTQNAGFVASAVRVAETPPREERVSPGLARILVRIPCAHPGFAVRRDVLERFGGFDESYRISADYDLMLRMMIRGVRFGIVKQSFATFEPGGVSSDADLRLEERIRMMKAAFDPVHKVSADDWRWSLQNERPPAALLKRLIVSPRMSMRMRGIAAYQLFRVATRAAPPREAS